MCKIHVQICVCLSVQTHKRPEVYFLNFTPPYSIFLINLSVNVFTRNAPKLVIIQKCLKLNYIGIPKVVRFFKKYFNGILFSPQALIYLTGKI